MRDMMVLGIDTGGTFTDFVLFDGERLHIHKVLSTPEAPDEAIATGMAELGLEAPLRQGKLLLVHGSTVATNAALEGKGVPTLFVTNRGFRDLLTIGRQSRRELYELMPAPLPPPVPAELCFEVDTRRDHLGRLITPLTDADLTRLRHAIATLAPQAVAICLLYSFMDESEEQVLAAALPPGLFVSCSSQVLPEYREYERGIATWLNSWLGPLVSDYLGRLSARTAPAPLTIMQSSGGTVAAEQARQRAVNLLLSGPAGGMAAARHLADTLGERQLITFDMGGTSTDVGLLSGGELTLTNEGRIGPYPVAVPMVDLHTIGAGGGSIAFLDDGGGLWVGPRSAGALPGPACYGRGGREPTVTDANLLLGRLRPERFLGGAMPLDVAAAQRAIATLADPLGLSLEETAAGIIEIANEQMIRALRLISVERGHDPRQFRLCCFGGAGGLHLCRLAEALGIRHALVPLDGGVFSAFGMLVAPQARQLSRSCIQPFDDASGTAIDALLARLDASGVADLRAQRVDPATLQRLASVDLRYRGQSFTLNLPWQGVDATGSAFHALHEQRYGHRLEMPIELVNVRLLLRAPARPWPLPPWQPTATPSAQSAPLAGFAQPVPIRQRESLRVHEAIEGPLLLTERTSTTLLLAGWRGELDLQGHLLLNRE